MAVWYFLQQKKNYDLIINGRSLLPIFECSFRFHQDLVNNISHNKIVRIHSAPFHKYIYTIYINLIDIMEWRV